MSFCVYGLLLSSLLALSLRYVVSRSESLNAAFASKGAGGNLAPARNALSRPRRGSQPRKQLN